MAFKASSFFCNEDALLVRKQGERYLLAVADGHFGLETSHCLLSRLSEAPFPDDADALNKTVHCLQFPVLETAAGSTLTVAIVDLQQGLTWGVYTGDSKAVVLTDERLHSLTEDNQRYVYFHRPLQHLDWETFDYPLRPGSLLLLFTDGINECHYRSPETSIQPGHMTALWQHVDHDAERFHHLLVELALKGVEGHPGGQDNIALISLKRPED
jgi:serine/threonine protein phosphatase PrpC